MRRRLACLALCAGALLAQKKPPADVVLDAMRDEIARSKSIRIANLDAPYYIEYAVDDLDSFSVSATLGGVIDSHKDRTRVPRIQVRVGDYKFDNTNYLFSDRFRGPRFDANRMPLDDDYLALRTQLWLATDRVYKGSVEAIARKRSALKNVSAPETLNDYAKAEPVQLILPVKKEDVGEFGWTKRVKETSGLFAKYPAVLLSGVEFQFNQVASYLANSEGTEIRMPDHLASFRIRALGQAPDGMPVHDAIQFYGRSVLDLPTEAVTQKAADEVGANITALAEAPMAEAYSGPVLFEPLAATQLFAQVFLNFAPVRKPVNEPGRNFPVQASEFEGREGSRILPEFFDVVDDPTQTEWRGRALFGHYLVDMEGVKPVPLQLVEKGVLKNLLLTRQPVRGHEGSNGRARLPGRFGADSAGFGNLFIKASGAVNLDELKKRFRDLIAQRGKPYGILIRKLDFPSSASVDELRKVFSGAQGQAARPVSVPLLVYRVYPNGKEELVRGLRFRGLDARSLRDITAASDDAYVFDYLENGVLLALSDAGGYVANTTVVSPAVLFDDLELERVDAEWSRPPIVPAPALTPSEK